MSNSRRSSTTQPCGDRLESNSNEEVVAESSSSPSQFKDTSNEIHLVLDEFRADWQKELHEKHNYPHDELNRNTKTNTAERDKEALAKSLYRTAVDLEQKGKVYDAIPFYRRAVQIEPNIEFKYYDEHYNVKIQNDVPKEIFKSSNKENQESGEVISDDLCKKFQLDLSSNLYEGKLIRNNYDGTGIVTTELHMSDLPFELISYILRWVISNQLDMRSLEQCAAVCKGLYLCARDEELWRLACLKVWGNNVGTLTKHDDLANSSAAAITTTNNNGYKNSRTTQIHFSTWRQMFIERERVLFNGCYISKTTYLRMGENSFQDQYYRPVQLVEYYRYLRFLTDGTVLMMTTADEPVQAVGRLKNMRHLKADILKGKYHLHGNTLSIVLRKQQQTSTAKVIGNVSTAVPYHNRYRRGSNVSTDISTNNTKYFLKFHILNTKKRKFSQLKWMHYSIVQARNKHETTNEFELTPSKYPSLWFSIVRSYDLDAESPLA